MGPENLYALSDALLEVVTQLVVLVAACVDWMFTEHLLLSNIISAGLLLGLADITIQTLEIYLLKSRDAYESGRNYRSMEVGMILGVFNHMWYAFLEDYLIGSGLAVVFKKIALDQAVAGPFFSSAFLVGTGLLEGRSRQDVYKEWSEKFIHIYMVDWMFWPLAQFINFYLVPYRFRVFYVNLATFLWNTFLCYAKHVSCGGEVKGSSCSKSSSPVHHHRSPAKRRKDSTAVCRASRKCSRSPSASRSRAEKKSHPKRGSRLSTRRAPSRSKLRHRHTPSVSQRKLPAITYNYKEPAPDSSPNNTMKTIMSVKRILPYLNRATLSYLHDGAKTKGGEQFDSWATESNAVGQTSSMHSCSSISSLCSNKAAGESGRSSPSYRSSFATITGSSTSKRPQITQRGGYAVPRINMPTVRRLGVFAVGENEKDAHSHKTYLRQPLHNRVGLQPRVPLSMPGKQIGQQPAKPTRGHTFTTTGEVTKKMWPARVTVPAASSVRTVPARLGVRTTPKDFEDIRDAVLDLKNMVTAEHQKLSAAVRETQSQVSRLQELCSVIYVAVDDGTRDLTTKADQLASWVALERKLNVGDIKAAMEEVLVKK